MDIIFYHQHSIRPGGLMRWQRQCTGANVREWKAGDNAHADYALVWHPPVEMLAGRKN